MAVGNGVRGDLVAVGVQVLHLGVVGPLVRHVEGSLQKSEYIFTFKLNKGNLMARTS